MIRVGEQIKALRQKNGYNQEQLAELANLNRVTIAKYESGKVEPGAQALARIADALEVTVDELLGRNVVNTDEWNPDDMDYADKEDETIKIMTRGMKRMSAERRQKLLEMVRLVFSEDFDEEGHKRDAT